MKSLVKPKLLGNDLQKTQNCQKSKSNVLKSDSVQEKEALPLPTKEVIKRRLSNQTYELYLHSLQQRDNSGTYLHTELLPKLCSTTISVFWNFRPCQLQKKNQLVPVAISQQCISYLILSQVSLTLTHFLKPFSAQAELGRTRWLRGLMRGSVTFRLLGLPVRTRLWAQICLLSILCVRQRSLRRADSSSRGLLLSVVCLNECYLGISTMRKPWTNRAVQP